jgi:Protein of unknown function (DUF3667)
VLDAGTAARPVPRAPAVVGSAGSAAPACTNCASSRVAAFCAECGERQPAQGDLKFRTVLRDVGEEVLSLDGRLWRSVVTLLSRPGELTAEYFAGRKGRYMRPFSLFLVLNVLFFVARPYTGLLRYDYTMYVDWDGRRAMAEAKRAETGLSRPAFAQAFDRELEGQKKTMMLVAIPLFALALGLLYARSGRGFVEHLVFSVHAWGFLLFYLLALGTVGFLVIVTLARTLGLAPAVVRQFQGETALVVLMGTGTITYLTFALRRYYRSSWAAAVARATILFAVIGFLVVQYKNALFHSTLALM